MKFKSKKSTAQEPANGSYSIYVKPVIDAWGRHVWSWTVRKDGILRGQGECGSEKAALQAAEERIEWHKQRIAHLSKPTIKKVYQ